MHLPTPHLNAVIDEHGPDADESAIFGAALADGYGAVGAPGSMTDRRASAGQRLIRPVTAGQYLSQLITVRPARQR
jgi:hypothetical protein